MTVSTSMVKSPAVTRVPLVEQSVVLLKLSSVVVVAASTARVRTMLRTRLTASVVEAVALVVELVKEVLKEAVRAEEACASADVASVVVVAADEPQLFKEKPAAVNKAVQTKDFKAFIFELLIGKIIESETRNTIVPASL